MPYSGKLAIRALTSTPAFTATAVLTLMLGAGLNTAMFTVVDALMLRPVSLPQPQELALIYVTNSRSGGGQRLFADDRTVEHWTQSNRSFESIGGYAPWRVSVTGQGAPERADAVVVVGDLFRVLQVRPALGRMFRHDEIRNGASARVALLSHAYWRRRFGGDADILGRTMRLDGNPYTIVGVMPIGFAPVLPHMPRHADIWTTTAVDFTARGLYGGRAPVTSCQAIGRLRRGVTTRQAQAEFDVLAKDLNAGGVRYWGDGIRIVKASGAAVENLRPALLMLFAAVACVLLIACANIAGLMWSRQTGRRRETAIRAALGASRGRLVREALAESAIISITGSALGLVAAHWLLRALEALSPIGFDELGDVHMHGTVLLFAAGLSVVDALLFGLAPALSGSRRDLNAALKDAATAPRRGLFSTRALVTSAEVALAAGLLITAGLLLRSFVALRAVDTGFETQHLIAASLPLPENTLSSPARRLLIQSLAERLQQLPGVESTGFTNSMAMSGLFMMSGSFTIDGASAGAQRPEANLVGVTAGYFHATGMPLLAGRYFTDEEALRGDTVMINEAGARRYFGGARQAVGRRIRGDACASCVIAGVVGNLRNFGLKNDTAPELYESLFTMPCPSLDIAVRTWSDPTRLIEPLRRTVAAVAPELALERISAIQEVVDAQLAQPRFNAFLIGVFAALALLLAAVGVFGVTALWVGQRTREIGVRMSLGAESRTVLGMVLRQALATGAVGIVAGAALGLLVTRLLRSVLFGVGPNDPATFLVVAAAMLGVIAAAAWIPARRAARVDPMVALRDE
ncbi:MAG TPA: ABC transporter permease [Bryobacteraceae bacterium]|nr:ABC transporter permease [Bryobacteraceae bacterium]